MGFWQGINRGFAAVQEEKIRKGERQEEVDLRKAERDEERAFTREMYDLKVKEGRLNILQERELERRAAVKESEKVTEATIAFQKRLTGVDPEVVKLYMSNPMYAAEAEFAIQEVEKIRFGKGNKGPMIAGNLLVEMVPPPSSRVPSPTIDISDFENLDITDDENYFDLLERTAVPTQQKPLINPEIYYIPDPKVLEEGRTQVINKVLEYALERLSVLNKDETRTDFSVLEGKLKNFVKVGSPERVEIIKTFGPAALADLMATDNPYIQDLLNTPEFASLVEPAKNVAGLRAVANDPRRSEEEREEARQLLLTDFGVSR
jgi:hypothetical protein